MLLDLLSRTSHDTWNAPWLPKTSPAEQQHETKAMVPLCVQSRCRPCPLVIRRNSWKTITDFHFYVLRLDVLCHVFPRCVSVFVFNQLWLSSNEIEYQPGCFCYQDLDKFLPCSLVNRKLDWTILPFLVHPRATLRALSPYFCILHTSSFWAIGLHAIKWLQNSRLILAHRIVYQTLACEMTWF